MIDLLFETPILTTASVAERLGVTTQAALNYARELESRGWLYEADRRDPDGRRYWVAREVMAALGGDE